MYKLTRLGLITTVLGATAWGPSANAAMTLSSAYGMVGGSLNVLGGADVYVGPVIQSGPDVEQFDPLPSRGYGSGSGVTGLSESESLNLTDSFGVSVANLALSTGFQQGRSSYFNPGGPTGSDNSTVDDLLMSLTSPAGTILFGLSAATVTLTTSVDRLGILAAVGSSTIEGLKVSGSALGGVTIDGSMFVNPLPNTTLYNSRGIQILLNEQIIGGDSITSTSIESNAIHIIFNDFALPTGILNGDIIIADSELSINTVPPSVPEPVTWAMMLVGLGAIGFVARRRQQVSLAYA